MEADLPFLLLLRAFPRKDWPHRETENCEVRVGETATITILSLVSLLELSLEFKFRQPDLAQFGAHYHAQPCFPSFPMTPKGPSRRTTTVAACFFPCLPNLISLILRGRVSSPRTNGGVADD